MACIYINICCSLVNSDMEAAGNNKRKCNHCNRWFPNGKSLGGHMKSHLSLTNPKGTPGAGGTSSKPQKKRKAPLISSSTGEEEDHEYKCKVCGKGFQCWRSYLGHIRWHQLPQDDDSNNDMNITIYENASDEVDIIQHAARMLVALSRMECSCDYFPHVNVEEKKEKHECPVCHRIFSSGKALGGHKRAHMPPVPGDDAGKSKVLQKKLELGFDLNVEPPEDSDQPSDDEVVAWEDDAKNASN